MPPAIELLQLLVGELFHHLPQLGVFPEEIISDIGPVFDDVFLVLAIDYFPHAVHELAVRVGGQQGIPVTPPDDLDDVPARAAEAGLQLLDDLPVPPDRPVEALQVTVDDEDQVIEFFAYRQVDGPQRFGLIGFTVADKAPYLLLRRIEDIPVLEIAEETGVVDRHDRAQPH